MTNYQETSTIPAMELRDVSKMFGGTRALSSANIAVYSGEVHCLLGDNGAGKSTLIKLMSGVYQPSSGTILIGGKEEALRTPRSAQDAGIATVHQDVGMIPLMSVARNFFLGREPTKGRGPLRRIDMQTARGIALEQVHAMGIRRVTNADQPVGTLSGGERQALAIARATYFGARVLILDEPTSALGVKEASIVLDQINAAREQGLGVVFITHNANYALATGDRFTVLIQGKVADSWLKGERSRNEVLDLMAGGETLDHLFEKTDELN
jgi:simple sugar transport system ATP-binding protein